MAVNPLRRGRIPNVVVVLAAELGYGDLSCQGQTNFVTPNLDRLAREGIRFTDAYAGSPHDVPSRCSFITGKHSGRGRVRSEIAEALLPQDVTLAEVLRVGQYTCGAMGQWSLGGKGTTGHPLRQGFHEFFGTLNEREAEEFYPASLWRNEWEFSLKGNEKGGRVNFAPDRFLDASQQFLRINSDQPFFLYLATTLPRGDRTSGTNDLPKAELGPFEHKPWTSSEKAKAAMVTRLDETIGVVITVLQQLKIDDQTLVIFSSVTGPDIGNGGAPAILQGSGPFRGGKGDLHEGGIRIPLIARWPGTIAPAQLYKGPIAAWDILPTVAEASGIEPPTGLDGISFAPALLGKPQLRTHAYLYWETHGKQSGRAIRVGDWKLVIPDTSQPPELYQIASDPGETNNLAAADATRVESLRDQMAKVADPWIPPAAVDPKAGASRP
ncbi:MAG: N-acetylgalactosamine-6-sulfatase [Pedosphaera sp.]|nr:N-acetylgalactosamine-6-sulfatase [Pedosphaera sp.]